MKPQTIFTYLGWASGLFGALLILGGIIDFFVGGGFLGVKYYFNFFFYSIPFMLLGIFFLVGAEKTVGR
jgi:hypothetical protein